MTAPFANAGADQTFSADDVSGSLNATLSGSGTPGTGASSITGYAWSILAKPPGSACAIISGGSTATPTVGPIDVWGNYRFFLVVTDNLGQVSANAPLSYSEGPTPLARQSDAVVYLRVTGSKTGLQQPASGEQNSGPLTNAWATAIEGLDAATDPATTSTLGLVELDEAPVDSDHPKAVTRDRIALCATVRGKIAPTPTSGTPAQSTAQVVVPEDGLTLTVVKVSIGDRWASGRDPYSFSLRRQTSTQFAANTFPAEVTHHDEGAPGGNANKPLTFEIRGAALSLAENDVLSLKITGDPDSGDQMSDMTVIYYCERRV